ncbi:MAG: class I SAM-dependent methyltransferase [Bryobacterales bacterium]|nr:class I SAM-dependent methyltransferase [Bryobacterales bacterium]
MSTHAAAEKAYYEARYAAFLDLPPDDLRFTPSRFLADLEDPRKEVYERKELYRATLTALGRLNLRGRSVLDYGCGTGDFGLWMATAERARVTFLDLSENAVEVCLKRAAASGVATQCDAVARDAADLSCFADAAFDLVYGCASLHHTIKYPGAWSELLRVLKPGGDLVLTETYGNNALLNALRRWNWKREGLSADQGEDVIFDDEHAAILRRHFPEVVLQPIGLFAMAKRALRGRFHLAPARALLRSLQAVDAALLGAAPRLKSQCGEVLVVARRRV